MSQIWMIFKKEQIRAEGASLGNVEAGTVTKPITIFSSTCRIVIVVQDENGNISEKLSNIEIAAASN